MKRPVARPVASSSRGRNAPAQAGSRQISATEDSSSPRLLRVSADRLQRIAQQLTASDREVLELVADLRLCSGAQLERMVWWQGEPDNRGRAARRALKRLTEWRVLDRLPRAIGGVRAGSQGFVYGVGPVGRRLLAAGGDGIRRLVAPGARHVGHTLAVAELVTELHEADRGGRLELLAAETEPTCWRRFSGPMSARLTVKPDLHVRIGVGSYEDRWFIEVDRATEASATITGKGRQYLAHYKSGAEQAVAGVYPRVLWSVPDDHRAEIITDALPRGTGHLFAVCRHDQVVGRLAEEARS